MKSSTADYWDDIQKSSECIANADVLLIGVGSGLTASGGLSYSDPVLAQKWYPDYFEQGQKSIIEIMSNFWPNTINEKKAVRFWGFWAKHIWHIRYEPQALKPYLDLFSIANRKEYFICSTNVDGQLEKAGFEKNKIFAPQGDYALFQCSKPCSQDVYDNNKMITTMLENMVSPFEICHDDIPFCQKCGNYLIPNLRCDDTFVETPHLINAVAYKNFIQTSNNKKIVLFELGVGYNTPVIIRYPFEAIALKYPNATLIRINVTDADVSKEIIEKSISIQEDIGKVLSDILNKL
jgi:NAD-dependent SIR2 family protein deacetylase